MQARGSENYMSLGTIQEPVKKSHRFKRNKARQFASIPDERPPVYQQDYSTV